MVALLGLAACDDGRSGLATRVEVCRKLLEVVWLLEATAAQGRSRVVLLEVWRSSGSDLEWRGGPEHGDAAEACWRRSHCRDGADSVLQGPKP